MATPKINDFSARKKQLNRRAFLKIGGLALLAGGLVACDADTPGPTPEIKGPASELGDIAPSPSIKGPASELGDTPATSPRPASSTAPLGSARPSETALAFLKAWEDKRYSYMYALLTSSSRTNMNEAQFTDRYQSISDEISLSGVDTKLTVVAPPPGLNAIGYEVPFDATLKTARIGDIKIQNSIKLRPENNRWLVDWSPALILPQLVEGNTLKMLSDSPPRGEIKDINGVPMAVLGSLYSVFVVPGKIENEEQVLTTLGQALNLDKQKIKNAYKDARPDWRMNIKDLPRTTGQDVIDKLIAVKGIGVDEKGVRSYPQGASAAHITGYLGSVNEQDLKTLAAKGYTSEDVVGRTGIEAWAEDSLVGIKGGRLRIIKPDGSTAATLGERPSQPASNVILTLDMKAQKAAEAALAGRNGSVVVMNPTDGAILALVSQPAFDPNQFIQGFTEQQYKALSDDPRRPFQNRPVNGTYPTGSIFKLITASCALERAGLTMDSRFTCTGHWEGLGPQYAKDCYIKTGHGNITLNEAIIQSCDVVFYELGKKLDELDPLLLPGFTKAFGLGTSTNLVGLSDSAGVVPDSKWKLDNVKQSWFSGDAVNLAIGQGYLLATPLQMATVYAGLANAGPVPVPRLIARTERTGLSAPVNPQTRLQLPVNPTNMARLRSALLDVTQSPRGTANAAFAGSKIKVAGKTGTAESGKETPHAWFACYAPADKPKYVVIVMLEEAGFGNALAAPAARKVIDALSF